MTYSFESPKVFDKLLIPEDSKWRKTVVISNPLGEDYSIMRTLPLNGMLTSLSTNFGRRNKDVRLYEMGNIYLPKQLPLTELPEERMQLNSYTRQVFARRRSMIHMPSFRSCTRDARRLSYMMVP